MLFWCIAVCARGHGDILLEESLCGVLSVKEYLIGVRSFPVTSVCVCVQVSVYLRERESERARNKRKE